MENGKRKTENSRGEVSPSATMASPFPPTPSPRGKPLKPQIICITGQMAAGKNFICSQLEKEGFVSLDLDKTAHTAISLCTPQI
ncbi:MAG: hypothetical protein IJR39_13140, partial [Treponema sp.]|nr:hypothetical protein [Treponema sp.]